MTAENPAGDGGEHAKQSERESRDRLLLESIGDPIAVMRGDEIIRVGISHGVRDGEVWVRDRSGELDTYGLDEFTFIAGDESEVIQYLDDIFADDDNPDTI